MPDLSPETQRVLEELRPILLSLAQDTIAAALRQMPMTHVELGTVTSIDPLRGVASVVLDSRSVVDTDPLEADVVTVHPRVNERVWVDIVPPHGPRVVGTVRGLPGLVGFDHADADVPLSTSTTVVAQVIVPVQAFRLIRISCHVPQIDTPAGASTVTGWVGGSAFFGQVDCVPVGNGMNGELVYTNETEGLLLFQFALATDAGTAIAQAAAQGSSPGPITLTVEDIGSAFA